jgi:hypothetical protein
MAAYDPKVVFEIRQIGPTDWQIRVHCPGAELQYVDGFKSEAEAKNWPESLEGHAWLKARGWTEK